MEFSFFLLPQYKLTNSFALGIFLFVFMTVFLPFGVSNYDPHHSFTLSFFLGMSSFMIGTIVMALLNEFFLKPIVIRNVGLTTVILWSAWLLMVLGLTNYIVYNLLGNWHDFSFQSGVEFIVNCSSVFIFPLVGILFYYRYKALKEEFEQVQSVNSLGADPRQLIHFEGSGVNDKISLALEDFLYARAQDNYVELVYLSGGYVKKELLRSSMNQLVEKTNSDYLVRCHRSYVVNIFHVNYLKDGSRMELKLSHLSEPIQVSRTYRETVLKHLKSSEA